MALAPGDSTVQREEVAMSAEAIPAVAVSRAIAGTDGDNILIALAQHWTQVTLCESQPLLTLCPEGVLDEVEFRTYTPRSVSEVAEGTVAQILPLS